MLLIYSMSKGRRGKGHSVFLTPPFYGSTGTPRDATVCGTEPPFSQITNRLLQTLRLQTLSGSPGLLMYKSGKHGLRTPLPH